MKHASPLVIGPEAVEYLSWHGMLAALEAGHQLPQAQIADSFLYRDGQTLLNRSAMIDGLGSLVKTATVTADNPAQGKPMVNGAVSLFSELDGTLEAIIDFHLVTYWKTACDSLLAAQKLAPPNPKHLLIIGAGTVAGSLIAAYRALWPDLEVTIWNRTTASAEKLAAQVGGRVVADLPDAVAQADIVSCATMSSTPVLHGEWLRPGQHIDLIGAYRPDMREADDLVLGRGRVFVDSLATTVEHIGELKIPLESGVLSRDDIVADYYQLDLFTRAPQDITVFKNGGGAHLDLMVAREILNCVRGS